MSIIDAHAHIYSSPTLGECEKTLLRSMKKYGISFSLASDCDGAEFPSGASEKVKKTTTLNCLKRTVNFAKANPTKIGAAVWIRPVREKEPSPELRAYVKENRRWIYALKFHPFAERTPILSPLLTPWLHWAEDEGLPILVHTAADEFSDIEFLAEAAKLHPSLSFIAAHLQLLGDREKAIKTLQKAPNLYGDTAWVPMEIAAKAISALGEERLLFGTDNPIDGLDTLGNPLYKDYFENALGLSEDAYRKMMFQNAVKLFGLPFGNGLSEVEWPRIKPF
ncbi:MAG TPA: hypothetical protein DEA63_03585 [Firmicutes bacterium]|nr:hypothetical protein [Bacillota bacterium]